MCGFAGIVGRADHRETVVGSMLAALRHRGPDDEGYYEDSECALGHCRLSIIDLSPNGRQPMANEDGTVQLVFNGELYNFGEAREDLQRRGHVFRSRTDSEVVVHLYEEHGEAFLQHVRGMFAIGLWDTRRRKLLLARDHFGQKPLFYAPVRGGLAFASEIKGLLRHPGIPRDVDPKAIDLLLTLGFVPSPHSCHAAIRRIPPASLLTFEPGGEPRIRGYWALEQRERRISFRQALEEVDQHLDRAVREQLVADVPVGVLLSGGIDSSLVLAKAAHVSSGIDTVTVGFEEADFSELQPARRVSERFGSRHHSIVLRASDVREPERIIDLFDEPFADVAALPQAALAHTAREHVKVALTGDGGDELFAGYQHHVLGYWLSRTARLDGLRVGLARAALRLSGRSGGLGSRWRSIGRALQAASLPGSREPMAFLGRTLRAEDRVALYAPSFLETVDGSDPEQYRPAVDSLLRVDGDLMLADRFLYKTDIASMSVGLECRSPFLDLPLVELATALPLGFKVRGLKGKALLRRLLSRYVDRDIWNRRKMGLSMPLGAWLKRELAPMIRDTLLAPGARVKSYAQPARIARLYEEHCSGAADHRRVLWALLLLELWLRRRYGRPEGSG